MHISYLDRYQSNVIQFTTLGDQPYPRLKRLFLGASLLGLNSDDRILCEM